MKRHEPPIVIEDVGRHLRLNRPQSSQITGLDIKRDGYRPNESGDHDSGQEAVVIRQPIDGRRDSYPKRPVGATRATTLSLNSLRGDSCLAAALRAATAPVRDRYRLHEQRANVYTALTVATRVGRLAPAVPAKMSRVCTEALGRAEAAPTP
jgi:hypothetical protein